MGCVCGVVTTSTRAREFNCARPWQRSARGHHMRLECACPQHKNDNNKTYLLSSFSCANMAFKDVRGIIALRSLFSRNSSYLTAHTIPPSSTTHIQISPSICTSSTIPIASPSRRLPRRTVASPPSASSHAFSSGWPPVSNRARCWPALQPPSRSASPSSARRPSSL